MVSDRAREQIWDSLLEIAQASRYFDALRTRYARWRNAVRTALALSGIGALASLIDLVSSPVLAEVLVAAVAAIVVLDLILDPATVTAKLTVVCTNMEQRELAIRHLWQSITTEDGWTDGQALAASSDILKAAHEAASIIDVPTHQRLSNHALRLPTAWSRNDTADRPQGGWPRPTVPKPPSPPKPSSSISRYAPRQHSTDAQTAD